MPPASLLDLTMSHHSALPCLALAVIFAVLTVQVEGRAFFGSLFQDEQLNNGTSGFGMFGSFLEALAALHQSHDLSSVFLGK